MTNTRVAGDKGDSDSSELQEWQDLIKSLPSSPSRRFITLDDLVNYINWYYRENIVPPDTPQHIIQKPALQNFAHWIIWQDELLSQRLSKAQKPTQRKGER